MKYSIYYLACLLLCGIAACNKEEPGLYNDNSSGNSIYFPMAENSNDADYSFGYEKENVNTITTRLPIRIIGSAMDYDRPYKLLIADSSTMKEGEDYRIVNDHLVIGKGMVSDTLEIIFNRTAIMKENPLHLYLELLPNEHFGSNMKSRTVVSGGVTRELFYTRLNITVDDIAGAPPFWKENSNYYSYTHSYLGTFSSLKFQLLINRFNLKVEEVVAPNWFLSNGNYFRLSGWGFGMQAWLNKMEAENNTVYEADGVTKMKMGPLVQ